ncbi:MAG: SANT/Myb domain-containing protein [Puniceicoccales bacterium]|jgi:hypothetical protein|nr:SANT/Myb domain-containing protein [Puniceicoccales bacterium]
MDRKLKLIMSASSALLNTLLASSLFATNLAPDVNSEDSGPGLPGFNSNPYKDSKKYEVWTEAEDVLLIAAIQGYDLKNEQGRRNTGKKWEGISEQVPGRSSGQCNGRWGSFLQQLITNLGLSMEMNAKELASSINSRKKSGPFDEEENAKLKAHVKKYGDRKWPRCTALLPGRTSHDCKLYYEDYKIKENKKKREEEQQVAAQQASIVVSDPVQQVRVPSQPVAVAAPPIPLPPPPQNVQQQQNQDASDLSIDLDYDFDQSKSCFRDGDSDLFDDFFCFGY